MRTTIATIVVFVGFLVPAYAGHQTGRGGAAGKPATTSRRTAPAQPAAAKPGPAIDAIAREAGAARDAGRLEDAIALYRKALTIQPSWAEGLWYLGTIQYDLDRYGDARDAFGRLTALDDKRGPAWAFKGLCEFQLRNYERALAALQRAVSLGLGKNDELSSVVRYHTAILTIRNGDFEQGLEFLTVFALSGNDNPRVIEAFGLATMRMSLLPSEAPSDKRELVLMAGRAGFYVAARQRAAARHQFEELLSRFPEAPNAHYAYGSALLVEDADKALEEFRRELATSPNHVPSLLQISFEYGKRSQFESALPPAKQAVELAPTMFAARKALGEALLGTGDVSGAIGQLEEGVKLAPDSPSLRFSLAKAYQRAGRTQDAERQRAEFLRLDKLLRTLKTGPQSVGGTDKEP
jgi:tetratricopeptide (TPR) repeat protein